MTTTEVRGAAPAESRFETPRVPLSRLTLVELRKQVDTRAGRWLLVLIGVVTAAVLAIVFFAAADDELNWSAFVGATAVPQNILLPVLGIMLVTSEWGQRTALVTYTLEPHRSRVSTAKLASAIVLGAVFVALALALAALFTVLAGATIDGAGAWDGSTNSTAGFGALQLVGVVQGVALGMLIMNTAGAIVTYFALPTVWGILTSTVTWFAEIGEWIDLNTTSLPIGTNEATADDWLRFAVATSIWVLLPLLLGWVRVLRREVKSA